MMAESTVKVVVLSDTLGYYETENDPASRVDYKKGDKLEMRAKDFERHERDEAVAKTGSKAAKAALGQADEEPEETE